MVLMSWIAPKTHELMTPDGRVLQYCLYGPQDGVPVIAQHGTPGGRWERPDVVAAIEDSGLRMLLVGRPGYGSTRQPGRSVADVAEDVLLLAEEVGWTEFAVTGFSGGGPHALACTALLPDRVNYCSTVAGIASPDLPGFDESLDWVPDARRGEAFLRDQLGVRATEILDGLRTDVPDNGRYERMCAACLEGLDGWIDDYLALTKPWGFDLQAITAPTDIWYGSMDDNTTMDHTEWLLANVPGATGRKYDGDHDPGDAAQREILRAIGGGVADGLRRRRD
jgi:pimeloyl-ACP methyl ester carboxylesterase